MDTPTAEQFEALSGAYERYRKEFTDKSYALPHPNPDSYTLAELTDLANKLDVLHFESASLCMCEASAYACDWLHSTPAFQMALKALPAYTPVKSFAKKFENALIARYERRPARPTMILWWLPENAGHYLRFISGVALICHNYLTGKSVRAALSGPETINRMNKLLGELKQLSASDWITDSDQRSLFRHIERLEKLANVDLRASKPASTRNDPDLASRLMAGELIRLHKYHFGAPHKRAVFQLMGLPFIDRPLEMRTIERLIKAKKRPAPASQSDSDTKPSISAELLTTEDQLTS